MHFEVAQRQMRIVIVAQPRECLVDQVEQRDIVFLIVRRREAIRQLGDIAGVCPAL